MSNYDTGTKERNLSQNTDLSASDLVRIVSSGLSRNITGQDFATAIASLLPSYGPTNRVRLVSVSQSVLDTDEILIMDATSGAKTATLPDCTIASMWDSVTSKGRRYTIKKNDVSVSNDVTITTTNSQTIDGNLSFVLSGTEKPFLTVISTGVEWITVD
tara:strand:+ start:6718 stop:7194 length:477 start_codon:yes stop_codon:yes gene_type:complete